MGICMQQLKAIFANIGKKRGKILINVGTMVFGPASPLRRPKYPHMNKDLDHTLKYNL